MDVNSWADRLPPVDAVRPARCPQCAAAGRPVGSPLGIVGHGTRSRQVRGPAGAGQPPGLRAILARRYRCRRCGAVLVVMPRGVLARRHFGAGAIALALLGFGAGRRVVDVRTAVGGQGETAGWATLRRWVQAAGSGRLWREVRASPPGWGPRAIAQRVAMTLAACAPCGAAHGGVDEQVFAGAAHAA